jgi:hypothetical protein
MSTMTFDRTAFAPRTSAARTSAARTSAARTSAARTSTAQLKLTRRGKATILSVAVSAIGALAVVFGPSSTATDEVGTPAETTMVRVLPGHTLWKIAAEANPDGDIRSTVDQIIDLNALPNASALQMGAEIAVPVYDK